MLQEGGRDSRIRLNIFKKGETNQEKMIIDMFGISLPLFIYGWVVKREYALQIYIFYREYLINTDTRAQQRLSESFEGTASWTLPERAGAAPDCF